jgi:glutamate 5-kinase
VLSAQILLTFQDVAGRVHYLNARRTLRTLLDWGVVPIVNENDTTTTDEISFGDNDFLAAQLAILVGAERLLILTTPDGLFTADPSSDPSAELVSVVKDFAQLDGLTISDATSALGSGGMRSKVIAAEMATAGGVQTVVCSGRRPEALRRALAGEPEGTLFPASQARYSSFKLWLKYAKPSRGAIRVDGGAARALSEQGTSLLPVGIVSISGDFSAGDAVDVLRADDDLTIGKGISNFDSGELQSIIGMRTTQLREVLPRATDEAIHRDYFVLE